MIKIQFETCHATFLKNKELEVARILKEIAAKIENGHESGKVMDMNGNSCGKWKMV